MFESESRVM